jgi:hypothetical protein
MANNLETFLKGGNIMDKKEKKARKEKLGEYMDVSGSRLKDDEIEKLEYLVNNRDDLDGAQKNIF